MGFKSLLPQNLKNLWHLLLAVLANVRYGFPSRRLFLLGVTGTDGKTTTSTLIYHFLKSQGYQVGLVSTVAAYLGARQIDTGFHVTSPDPWQLQRLLRTMVRDGYTHAVLETTSHGLDQFRFYGIHFQVAVLTNLTQEHLDYHRSMDSYARSKAKLFGQSRRGVVNPSDPSFKVIQPHLPPQLDLVGYPPKSPPAPIRQAIAARFPQAYNRLNAWAAYTALAASGIPTDAIPGALAAFPGIPGRMEAVPNSRRLNLIIDFAHTPNSLQQALTSLKQTYPGKLIAVYGAAGLRDRQKRPHLGRIGSQLADEVVLTAEDPRTEPVWSIIDQIYSGVTANHGHIHRLPDRQAAINFAVSLAKPGDTVAVFGKGHEQSMCFGKIETPWSDRQALLTALKAKFT